MAYQAKDEYVSKIDECEKYKVVSDYCLASKEENVKREIQENGPVVSSMLIYRDFLLY